MVITIFYTFIKTLLNYLIFINFSSFFKLYLNNFNFPSENCKKIQN